MSDKTKGKIRLFACGGTGLNIGLLAEGFRSDDNPDLARMEICYLDTSDSNVITAAMNAGLNHEGPDLYLIGKGGSGKSRGANYEEINANVEQIIQQYKPEVLNIFLSSASGGSGAVIASTLIHELLGRGECCVSILVGSADSGKEIENTEKTFNSLDGVLEDTDMPPIVTYFQNSEETPRATVDDAVLKLLGAYCLLYSGNNRELDQRDLHNWLFFNKSNVTTFDACVAQLTLLEGKNTVAETSGEIISVATLATRDSGTAMYGVPDYQCVGYLPEDASDELTRATPLHFVITTGPFRNIVKHMREVTDARKAARRASVTKDTGREKQITRTKRGIDL